MFYSREKHRWHKDLWFKFNDGWTFVSTLFTSAYKGFLHAVVAEKAPFEKNILFMSVLKWYKTNRNLSFDQLGVATDKIKNELYHFQTAEDIWFIQWAEKQRKGIIKNKWKWQKQVLIGRWLSKTQGNCQIGANPASSFTVKSNTWMMAYESHMDSSSHKLPSFTFSR